MNVTILGALDATALSPPLSPHSWERGWALISSTEYYPTALQLQKSFSIRFSSTEKAPQLPGHDFLFFSLFFFLCATQ